MPNCETRTDRTAEANDIKGVIVVADFDDADKLGKRKEWWTASPTWCPSLISNCMHFARATPHKVHGSQLAQRKVASSRAPRLSAAQVTPRK